MQSMRLELTWSRALSSRETVRRTPRARVTHTHTQKPKRFRAKLCPRAQREHTENPSRRCHCMGWRDGPGSCTVESHHWHPNYKSGHQLKTDNCSHVLLTLYEKASKYILKANGYIKLLITVTFSYGNAKKEYEKYFLFVYLFDFGIFVLFGLMSFCLFVLFICFVFLR